MTWLIVIGGLAAWLALAFFLAPKFGRRLRKAAEASTEPLPVMGLTNPVIAAKLALLDWDMPIDEQSFDDVAELRGDSTPEQLAQGFVVESYDDIERLCQLGEFCILQTQHGTIKAMLPHEMQELVQANDGSSFDD